MTLVGFVFFNYNFACLFLTAKDVSRLKVAENNDAEDFGAKKQKVI